MAAAEHFATRLRELRTAAGLSRKDLAEKAGMSEGAVRDYEQDHRRPSWEAALALATALGVECTAFSQPPTSAAPPVKRGRPRKQPTAEVEAKPAAKTGRKKVE